MDHLARAISTLMMYAESDSPNWQRQVSNTIDAFLAYYNPSEVVAARLRLRDEFTKVNPVTERSNAIQDMITSS